VIDRMGLKALALAGLCASGLRGQTPAAAQTPAHTLSANVMLASQYLFRGLSQTDRRPALQGGFDYAHATGFYAGVWGSNISWIGDFNPGATVGLELDAYLGVRRQAGEHWTWDLGFIHYAYPGTYPAATVRADTDELYGALAWRVVTVKYAHALGDVFGVPHAKHTSYLEASIAVPLGERLTLNLHGGRQAYQGHANGASNRSYSYSDWKAELAWASALGWSAGAGYSGTDALKAFYTPTATGRFIGEGQFYGFVKRNL